MILDVVSRRQLQRLAEITDRWWKRVDDSVVAVPAGDPTIAEGDDDIEVPVVIGLRAHWHRAARDEATKHAPGERGFWIDVRTGKRDAGVRWRSWHAAMTTFSARAVS